MNSTMPLRSAAVQEGAGLAFLGYQQTTGTSEEDAQQRLETVYARLIQVALERRAVAENPPVRQEEGASPSKLAPMSDVQHPDQEVSACLPTV